jgi:hypothetical protein
MRDRCGHEQPICISQEIKNPTGTRTHAALDLHSVQGAGLCHAPNSRVFVRAVSGAAEGARMNQLVDTIFSACPGMIELRAIKIGTSGLQDRAFVRPGDMDAVKRFVNKYKDVEIYFGVAARKDASSGKAENCSMLGAAFVDVDLKHTPDGLKRIEEFPLPPSAIVSSGGGRHLYWFLKEPIDLQQENGRVKSVLRRLAIAVGGDLASAEPAHVLRLPDTFNHKTEYGEPQLVRLLSITDDRYDLADFDDFLPAESSGTSSNNGDKKPPFDTPGAFSSVPHGKQHATLVGLAGKYRYGDFPYEIARDGMVKAIRGYSPVSPDEDAVKILDSVYRRYPPGPEPIPPAAEDPELQEQIGGNRQEHRQEGQAETNPEQKMGFIPQEYWRQYDVADIRSWECPELKPIIDGVLAGGNLCWLAAETQTGKTLFMLWVCLQLLNKGSLFDKFAITPVSKILYVACEDPARRFKGRLSEMITSEIEHGRFVVYVAPGLSLTDVLCFQFLENMIHEGGFDFVVIDTFQAATMGISSFDDEKLSIIIRHLLEITRKLGTTMVVNDHFRKTQNHKKRTDLDANDVKGSGGKLQNADVFLLMDRHNGQLRVSGKSKEWDKPIGFLLDIAPQGSQGTSKFSYAGDFEQFASGSIKRGEETRRNIIEAMRGVEWISTREIAFKTKISVPTVRRHVTSLLSDKAVVETGFGKLIRYHLVNQSQETT